MPKQIGNLEVPKLFETWDNPKWTGEEADKYRNVVKNPSVQWLDEFNCDHINRLEQLNSYCQVEIAKKIIEGGKFTKQELSAYATEKLSSCEDWQKEYWEELRWSKFIIGKS